MGAISIWFKFENLSRGQILPLLYLGESSEESEHNALIIEIGHLNQVENRKLYFTVNNGGFSFNSTEILEENTWHNFIAVVDEAGNRGYLNGKLMSDRSYMLGSDYTYTDFFAAVDSAEIFTIGSGRYRLADPFETFNGCIAEVAIFGEPLTEADAYTVFNYTENKIFNGTTGVDSHFNSRLQVSPNPVKDLLRIRSDQKLEEIIVYNISGEIVKRKNPGTRDEVTLHLGGVPDGIYFIRSGSRTARIIVEK